MVKNNDKQIGVGSFVLSVLLHMVFFIQYSGATPNNSSQAQAPVQDKRISLNLLKPVIQQEIKPKPVKKRKSKKKNKKTKKKLIKKVKKQAAVQQAVAMKVAKEVKRDKKEISRQLRQNYLDYVLTHIEGHKYYPHAARLRNIEGSVQVSFVLQKDGSISELSANGASILLRRAAKGSVNKALPLPVCPKDVECPIQVSYAMQFKIKQ